MEAILSKLLGDFSRADLYVVLFIYIGWKLRDMQTQIDDIKKTTGLFNGTVTGLKKDLGDIMTSFGDQIKSTLEKAEEKLDKVDDRVNEMETKSETADTKHDERITALKETVGVLFKKVFKNGD